MRRLRRTNNKKASFVRYMRLINNMTKGELCYKANLARSVLDEIENGTTRCTELNARRLAEVFGMPYEWERFLTKEYS